MLHRGAKKWKYGQINDLESHEVQTLAVVFIFPAAHVFRFAAIQIFPEENN